MKIKFNDNFNNYIMQKYDEKIIENLEKIEEKCKDYCPVDTGKLRDDIGYSYDKSTKKAKVGNTLDYAIFVNLLNKPYLEMGLYSTKLDFTGNKGEI